MKKRHAGKISSYFHNRPDNRTCQDDSPSVSLSNSRPDSPPQLTQIPDTDVHVLPMTEPVYSPWNHRLQQQRLKYPTLNSYPFHWNPQLPRNYLM